MADFIIGEDLPLPGREEANSRGLMVLCVRFRLSIVGKMGPQLIIALRRFCNLGMSHMTS